MTLAPVIRQETIVSVAINGALSAVFFVAVFGIGAPVAVSTLGRDFLPQAFMVVLMGSLIPGLLTARRSGTGGTRRIIVRSLAMAAAALLSVGAAAFALCLALHPIEIDPLSALGIKLAFGMVLAAVVTPLAVVDALRPAHAPASMPGDAV